MTIYKSKIGVWLVVPVVIVVASAIYTLLYERQWLFGFFMLGVSAFIVHLLITTYYVLDGSILRIKCGFLYNQNLSIASIYKIEKTNSLLSAPAASLDRLEVFYNRADSIVISPKDKMGFISELKAINPAIEIIFSDRK